jgi:malate dehydrogenase (quinone)
MDLTRYLIGEVMQSPQQRLKALHNYYPQARAADWHLADAGQRVQIIKDCNIKGGKLEFGTEIVTARDGTLSALLGASPGASTVVQAMIKLIECCFSQKMQSSEWQTRMKAMVPSFGESLIDNVELLKVVKGRNLATLGLNKA